ncbi:MAG TPA: hypothetical protein VFF51_00775 [Candidatus Methylomirabilis sp.]|nr:hypothetical protein [Candidatus Methylomirabilis sp.]
MKPTAGAGAPEERDRIIAYTCHGCGARGVDPRRSKKGNYTCPECGDQVEISEKRVVKKQDR